jgi:hypothetical protein
MTKYDQYNREERALCAHLFRLLHERMEDKEASPLGQFLKKLSESDLEYKNGALPSPTSSFHNIGIYIEAAIIRDAYVNAKPDVHPLIDELTRLVMRQESVSNCRLYSELPEPLNNIRKTHPKQISRKAETLKVDFSDEEKKVYKSLQGMFNAKPDMVLTIDDQLLVCEAKFTQKFDQSQINRTWNIAEVWANLLYKDLGFSAPPIYTVFTLGSERAGSDVSWRQVLEIAEETYGEGDRSRVAIQMGVELLTKYK